jgi:hypothetical protein
MQDTSSTGSAFLCPHSPLFKNTKKLGIETCVNWFIGVTLGNRLDTSSTTQRKHSVAFLNCLGSLFNEHIIALALNGKFIDFKAQAFFS